MWRSDDVVQQEMATRLQDKSYDEMPMVGSKYIDSIVFVKRHIGSCM